MQPSGNPFIDETEMLRLHDRFQCALDRTESILAHLAALIGAQQGTVGEPQHYSPSSMEDVDLWFAMQSEMNAEVKQSVQEIAEERICRIREKSEFLLWEANGKREESRYVMVKSQSLVERSRFLRSRSTLIRQQSVRRGSRHLSAYLSVLFP